MRVLLLNHIRNLYILKYVAALYKWVLLAHSVLSNLCIVTLRMLNLAAFSRVYLEQQRVVKIKVCFGARSWSRCSMLRVINTWLMCFESASVKC